MEWISFLSILPVLGLIVMVAIPRKWANDRPRSLGQIMIGLVTLQFATAVLLTLRLLTRGNIGWETTFIAWPEVSGLALQCQFDGTALLMLMMVSFVGIVVSRFSFRYLDGESRQGTYFCWLAFTIGSVSLTVLAGNLLLFVAAWMMTSYGLHHLLLHYGHRPRARRAAWTKFAISRLGDVFLLSALALTYRTLGTVELNEITTLLAEPAGLAQTSSLSLISWLLMLGAVTKSAQFPFHIWLPDTMETPTPISALMHAGIVNAGGYLVIRWSPLIVQAPAALVTLTIIGAITACFGGIVMMAQPSVKRSLAYSTIAQMGFMMLQCGLGAFSAAMLHIIAHSLYKAHAFLSSGSVVSQMLAARGAKVPHSNRLAALASLVAAATTASLGFVLLSTAFGLNFIDKPGGGTLAFILCLALTLWGARLFSVGEWSTTLIALIAIPGLCISYLLSYFAVDSVIRSSLAAPPEWLDASVAPVIVTAGFCFLFFLSYSLIRQRAPQWLEPLRVHAAHGFYIQTIGDRIIAATTRSVVR